MEHKNIQDILRENYADNIHHNIVSMVNPRGKFRFNRKTLDDFWELYCEEIYNNENIVYGIAEKPLHYLPVLVDIDIKIKETEEMKIDTEHLYNFEQVIQVIKIYQDVLNKILDYCLPKDLTCLLLEKPIYTIKKGENTYLKNGFHLHFPYIFLSQSDQESQLIPRIQKKMKELNVFQNLGFQDSSEVLDAGCCNRPWLLYGSRKSFDSQPYRLTKIFDENRNEVDLETIFSDYKLFNKEGNIISIEGQVRQYLPMILSIVPKENGITTKELKYNLVSPLEKSNKPKKVKKNKPKKINISIAEKLRECGILLGMLNHKRSADYNDWIRIGWILYNTGEGCVEALNLWLEFSQKDPDNYNEYTCRDIWRRMKVKDSGPITVGTLKYLANTDNPEAYKEFKNETTKNHLQDAINGSHNDIAQALYSEHGHEFVCSSISNNVWFQYINHKWEEIEQGIFLRALISSEIADKYVKMGSEVWAKIGAVEDKAERAMYESRFKMIQKLVINCKSATFKNNVMKECMEVFYNRNFRQHLDKNAYLIAFKNGVYDLKNNMFRDGIPEDFISKSMPINYNPDFTQHDDEVKDVYKFLEKIFPDTSIRKYFMDMSSDVFVGGNTQKVVLFWTGEGDNGKSVTQNIFEKMLGELAIKFSTTLITGKKTQTGGANPELARAGNGVRWAVLEEPDGDEQINIGTMKSLSGNDSFWARDLFEKGKATREMIPMFKLIFICNKLPKLKYSDKATWNRIRVIPFESTFVRPGETCPDTYEEQLRQKRFPMDKDFSKKIPNLLEAFAWVLIQHRHFVGTRKDPDKVRQATAHYRQQNDIYRQFIHERIVILDKNSKTYITLSSLYSQFKEWHRESFPNFQIPNKNIVREYFEKNWGYPLRGCKWAGYRIRTEQDDINENEEKNDANEEKNDAHEEKNDAHVSNFL